MSNTFMTVVGTGFYAKCTYEMDGFQYSTRFIQEAVLRILKEKGVEIDKIICLATEEAKQINWESFTRIKKGMKNRELKDHEVPENVVKFLESQELWEDKQLTDQGLNERFAEIYPDARIECLNIPLGSNEEELLNIFQVMYQAMGERETLYIDVTHGFRSMPMLYIPVIKYAEAIKRIGVSGIYYGAFEASGTIKPIFNLLVYKEILDWAFASNNFIQYGNCEELAEVARKRQTENAKKQNFSFNQEKKFVEALQRFSKCIQTGRGNEVSGKGKNTIRSEYNTLDQIDYSQLDFAVLQPLLQKVKESIKEFAKEGNTNTGRATVHWCFEKNMIQQGYTALEETIKSFVCDLYGYWNEVNKEIRDDVVGRAMTSCRILINRNKPSGVDERVYFKENQNNFYELLKENEKARIPDEYKTLFRKILESVPLDLVNLSFEVKDQRNDINHFGMRESSSKPDTLMKKFKEQVEHFDKIYIKYVGTSFD